MAEPDLALIHEPVPQAEALPVPDDPMGVAGARISEYLADCAAFARDAFAAPPGDGVPDADPVEAILRVLLGHAFNHQSRGRVAHLLPGLRRTLAASVERGAPIAFFMSYNGGYHATTRPDFSRPLGF
ncbi:MAG: hypothetical protein B7Z53_04880, partial [Rhodospirillales bacterium 12-71-4]